MAIIHVEQLTKNFDKKSIIKGLTFNLEPGKCVALLGPNGAGKTTTLRMLAGLLKPTSGNVRLEEVQTGSDIREHIGYLPQHPVFHSWMTGKEFLIYVGQLARLSKKEAVDRAEHYLAKVGIAEAKNQRIGKYSGGMKQRLGIAQAMIHRPKLIMLDEPVSALDPIGRRDVLNLMEELKEQTTVLFSTHILNDAEEVSDDLLLMAHGEIIEAGSLEMLRQKHQTAKIELTFKSNIESFYEQLHTKPWLTEIRRERNNIELLVTDISAARADILHQAGQEQWPLMKFEIGKTTLEDLFMKVVNH